MGTTGSHKYGWYHVVSDRHGCRLVAWDFTFRPYPSAGDLVYHSGTAWHDYHFPAGKDLAPHRAFCRGDMPSEVYADWLEEHGVPLPPDWYATLRGW